MSDSGERIVPADPRQKLTVAVIYGGRSGEHEVSLRSAASVLAAIDHEKYDVREFVIDKNGRWHPNPILPEPGANPGIDVVFPVLHGTFGEDGTVQGLLELAELPYVGAGVLASAAAMDKDIAKRLCRERGLPVIDHIVLYRDQFDASRAEQRFTYPMFVKPANLGSSVGISKVKDTASLEAALKLAARFDSKVIVERAVEGREFECSVMGNHKPIAATPCEIVPSREFYDYDDKYVLDGAEIRLPADLHPEKLEEVRQLAVQAYRAVDCEGMARVDFLLETATGELFINEVNTIPGFTSISMFPKMWEHAGVPYPELIDRLIGLALERQAARRETHFAR